jgi:sigma-B regulation protein RsbU (phosphoserine phosphatase)
MQSPSFNVLLIEHDAALAGAISSMLEQVPETVGKVTIVPSLEASLTHLKETLFDAILLEFFLPDGAGLANIPVLRAAAPRVPIVVLGTVEDEAVAIEAVHAGAQDYLVKNQLSTRWLLRALRYAIERNQAELALLDTEEQYRGLFDHLTEGIFRTSPAGRYLLANAGLARIYGYATPEELVQNITSIGDTLYVQPGRREEFMRLMEEHDTLSGFESPIFRKDGSIIWISENCRAIRDARGQLLYYEGTVQNITERRLAEEKVRNSETLYHSLVETLPQNIFRKDLRGRFTFANQQFCRTLGRTLEHILGKTDADFFPPELAQKYQADDRRVMTTGQNFSTVEEHQLPDGRKIFVEVVKTPLRGAYSQISGLQGIFWDITEQRLADERIRKANEALARNREELRRKNVQMEDDLKMASEIQITMLPQQYPVFPASATPETSALQFTHRYHPTGQVGGDFFSVSALSDTEAAVFLCDVAGHGVRSALVTAMIRALVEELRNHASEPGEFMTKLNSELGIILKHSGTPVLTTAFYFVADTASGQLRYANAGHPKPLLVRRGTGSVEPLRGAAKKAQPALGLFDKALYQTDLTTLAPRDLIMLFTDGLYEVHSPNEELFSQDLLAAAVRQNLQRPMPELFDNVLAGVRAFAEGQPFDDDVCILGMELAGPKPA